MSARPYDGVKLEMSLGDLSIILNAAEKYEALEKRNADLLIECERLAKENYNLRCKLSTRPTACEVSPLPKQRSKCAISAEGEVAK